VGTTVDGWSCHNKAYLGMTVHWLNQKTRAREHAVLACRRLTGSHTFDVPAEAMTDVHSKFGLQEKLRRTTADNGSNFVKAFNQFSSKAETLPDLPVAAEVLDTDEADLMSEPALLQFLDEPESETFIPVEDILQQNEHVTILPKHMRCAAHTFNLVATADAERALEDLLYLEASMYISYEEGSAVVEHPGSQH
jgi:hypothetical protein